METKDLIGLTMLALVIPAGVALGCAFPRLRNAAFFLLVAGTVLTEKLDVNFVSRYWYRGTTRGFEFTVLDVLAISVLMSGWLRPQPGQPRWYWPAGLGTMILYAFYCCFSVATAEPKLFGLFELSKILRGLLVFLAAAFFVRREREIKILVLGLGCAVFLEGALAIKQRVLGGGFRVTGSLDHPNSLSMYLCTVAPVLVAAAAAGLPKWIRAFCGLCLALAMVSILFTVSRAGVPIFGLVTLGATIFCVSWRITPQKLLTTFAVTLAVAGLVAKSWTVLKARFDQASFAEEYLDEKSDGRGRYLRQAKAIIEDQFLGVGLNNWSYWVSKSYGAKLGLAFEDYDDIEASPSKEILPSINYAAPAHSLPAITMGELGVPGLIVFVLVWMRWLQLGLGFLWKRTPAPAHRLGVGIFFGLCGLILQSQVEWVYRQTQIFFVAHILAGTLASLYRLKRIPKSRPRTPNSWSESDGLGYPTGDSSVLAR